LKQLFFRPTKLKSFNWLFTIILVDRGECGASHVVNRVTNFMSVQRNYSVAVLMFGVRFAIVEHTLLTTVQTKIETKTVVVNLKHFQWKTILTKNCTSF
jgi:hypothetical protein